MKDMKPLKYHLGKIALMLISIGFVGFVAVTPILGDEWSTQDVEPHPKFIWYETTALKVPIFSTALLSVASALITQDLIKPLSDKKTTYPASAFKKKIIKYSSVVGLVPLGFGFFASF
jgi:hypothetical protein